MPSSRLCGRVVEGVGLEEWMRDFEVTALRSIEVEGMRVARTEGGVRSGRCVR